MGIPFSSKHIYHITDTAPDKRAQGKIDGAYSFHRGRFGISNAGYSFLPASDTVDIGITLSEMILNSQRPEQLIIAVNCAPADKKEGTVDNVRNDFFCARLKDNVFVSGTSNGYEFSYVRDQIVDLFRLTVTNKLKSQFRSLEILPEYTLRFADSFRRYVSRWKGDLAPVKDIDLVVRPTPSLTHVHEVDNFQNVKLFPSQQDLTMLRANDGKSVRFSFGDTSIETNSRPNVRDPEYPATVAATLFAAKKGNNVLALRSSSRRFGGDTNVPMIATIRDEPAKTEPNYRPPIVGAPVWLAPTA